MLSNTEETRQDESRMTNSEKPFRLKPPWYRRTWVLVLFTLFSFSVGTVCCIASVIMLLMYNFTMDNVKAIEFANSLPLY